MEPLIIDIFKDVALWHYLSTFNKQIKDVFDKYVIRYQDEKLGEQLKDIEGNFISADWFDIDKLKERAWSWYSYPKTLPLYLQDKFSLLETRENYVSIFVIYTLYYYTKNIMIEDAACGMGKMVFYLSKLGFNNFSLIENFSQTSKLLLEKIMEKGTIQYKLNRPEEEINSVVYNQIEWPKHLRKITESLELLCFYGLMEKYCQTLVEKGFRFLCKDSDNFMVVYCREDKYDHFLKVLKPYEKL